MATYPFTLPALFDAIQDPAALIDAEGRFTAINQALQERASRRGFFQMRETWTGRHFWDTPLLRDPRGCEAFVRQALTQSSGGVKGLFVYDFGSEVYMELSLSPMQDLQGQVLGALVLWKNVTTQVRQQQRRQVMPQLREAVWKIRDHRDLEGVLVAVRNSLEELAVPFTHCGVNLVDTRTTPPAIHSHNMTQEGRWVQVEPNVPGARTIRRLWEQGKMAYRPDLYAADPYGEAEVIDVVFGPGIRCVVDVPFAQGTLAVNSTQAAAFGAEDLEILQAMARLLGEGFQRLEDFRLLEERNQDLEREVGERRRAEAALQESETGFRRLTDDLPIGITYSTPDGRILYTNPYNLRLLGYTLEEATAVRAEDLYLQLEDREELVRTLREKGEYAFEIQLRRKDGQPVWVRGKTRTYRDRDGQVYYLAITEDIDQRKGQELRQQVLQQVREVIWRMEKSQDLERL
ncbi:MAG: PAS domain S-box protein [Candidatus Latescibacteria bacterium]|nr:PAS domain S-box protein [Candidatus Latescibacterota bacterium]